MFRKYLLCTFGIYILLAAGECALPQPGPPILSCTLGATNSGSPQTIRITRSDMGGIFSWDINYFNKSDNTGSSMSGTLYSVPFVDIPVSDNSVIEVSIVFRDFSDISPQSPTATIRIGDRTPPTVNSTSPANGNISSALNAPVTISWSDKDIARLGVSWNISQVSINNVLITPNTPLPATSGSGIDVNGSATFNTIGQKYNQTVTVSVLLKDHEENYAAPYAFTYKTPMTAPDAPIVVWNPSGPNGGNTQQFTVTRPSTTNAGANVGIDNITQYNMRGRYQYTDTWIDIHNIAITSDQPISGVSDNCIVEVQVAFVGSPSPSDWSSSSTVTIGDRTAPSLNSTSPATGATNVTPNTPISIIWRDTDITLRGVSYNASVVTINGGSPLNMLTNGSRSSTSNVAGQTVQGTWTYDPTDQKYNQIVTVSVHLQDHAGNFMHNSNGTPRIETYTYKTVMTAPDAPTVTWQLPSALNSTDNQTIIVSAPATNNAGGVGIDNITQYNVQWRYSDGDWETLSMNTPISNSQEINNVLDNCIIEVQVRFVGSGVTSNWSGNGTITIGDRTPPTASYEVSINNSWVPLSTAMGGNNSLTNIEPNAPIRIAWSDKDATGRGVDWNVSRVTTAC